MMPVIKGLVRALLLTLVIEAAAGYALGFRTKYAQGILAFANIATNPPLNLLYLTFIYTLVQPYGIPPLAVLLPLEALAVLAEGKLFSLFLAEGIPHPYRKSFLINLISWLSGVIVNRLL